MSQKEQVEFIKSQVSSRAWERALRWLSIDEYLPGVCTLHLAMLDKMRWLQKLSLADRFFHELLAAVLSKRIEPILSDSVCSYRKGRGRKTVLDDMRVFLANYRARVPVVKERRLFALRLDVSSYTDSIPVGNQSELWKVLQSSGENLSPALIQNFKRAVRPTILPHDDFGEYCQFVGIPTGSPLTPVIANLYLTPLDHYLSTFPNSFYRRYGDDMVFVTSDEKCFDDVSSEINVRLAKLSLTVKAEKVKSICWSGSGAKHGTKSGLAYLDLLGVRILWNGKITIPAPKTTLMFRELTARMLATLRLMKESSTEEQTRALCKVSEDYFTERHPFSAPLLNDITYLVKDESYFRMLDFHTAKLISSLITENQTLLTFRALSWKSLIRKFQWKSPHFLMQIARKPKRSVNR